MLLDENGKKTETIFHGELADISMSGTCFMIHCPKKNTAAAQDPFAAEAARAVRYQGRWRLGWRCGASCYFSAALSALRITASALSPSSNAPFTTSRT